MDGKEISPNEDGGHLFELVIENAVAQLLPQLLLFRSSSFSLIFLSDCSAIPAAADTLHFALSKPHSFSLPQAMSVMMA